MTPLKQKIAIIIQISQILFDIFIIRKFKAGQVRSGLFSLVSKNV